MAENNVAAKARTSAELLTLIESTKNMGDLPGLIEEYTNTLQAEKAAVAQIRMQKLADLTVFAKTAIDKVIDNLVNSGKYDVAEGFWYVKDFGEKLSSLRLVKSAGAKATSGGTKPSYIPNETKSEVLLAEIGHKVYLVKGTKVMIDKVETSFNADQTYKEAWDFSKNGGWRNRVRQDMLKATSRI